MSGKTVWILNHYAVLPEETGGTRHYALARRLAEHGWQCEIIAASYSHWENRQRITGSDACLDRCAGSVRFRFVRTPAYTGNGVSRVVNMLCYFLRVLRPRSVSGLSTPDVIIGSSVHPLAALAAQRLAVRYGVPFIFEVRDLWPQTLIAMGRIRGHGITAGVLRALEKYLYRRAARIIVLLPKAGDYIKRYDIPARKLVWIPNGVDIDSEASAPANGNPFVITYLGAHGQANSLDTILDAVALLGERRLPVQTVFRFVGEGEQKQRLVRKSIELDLDNVAFENGVPKSRVPAVLSEADALIIAVQDLPELYSYGVSMNKLYDYMASARPVIIAMNAANNPVLEAGAGICVSPGDPAQLADAIESLVNMPAEQRARLGENGRQYVEQNHDYDRLADKLAALLNDVTVECGIQVSP